MIEDLEEILRGAPWSVRPALMSYVEKLKSEPQEEKPKGNRTYSQNRALWLWMTQLASILNEAGLDMKAVLKADVDISWSKDSCHDYIWIPIQKAALGTSSTTELGKNDIDTVRDHIIRHLGEKFPAIEIPPFPAYEIDLNHAPMHSDVKLRA